MECPAAVADNPLVQSLADQLAQHLVAMSPQVEDASGLTKILGMSMCGARYLPIC